MLHAHKTDFALPVAPVTDGQINALERELEQRRAIKAAQDAESARLAAEIEEEARIEQARKDAEEVERLKRLEIVEQARLVPAPSGSLLVENGLSVAPAGGIDTVPTQKRFGAVLKAEGPLFMPVVTCCGQVTAIKADALKVHRIASQLLIAGTEGLYLMAYRVAVREAWERIVAAEVERAGEGLNVIMYTGALPAVTVEKDELNPSLVRIVGTWGDCSAYKLPHL